MGQTAICQSSVVAVTESLVEHPGAACGLAHQSCSCLPSKSIGHVRNRVVPDDFETDESDKAGSDAEDVECGAHLVLARHRVFSPHLHTKFQSCYRMLRLLGEGTYGNVYEAEATETTAGGSAPRRVAAKLFVLQTAQEGSPLARPCHVVASRRASFERERSILARLEHPHLVRMYECFEDKASLTIVLELCRGGELYNCVAEKVRAGSLGGLCEQQGRVFFRQMLAASSYLHANDVVHRDLKTENFLLLGEPGTPHYNIIKLCDFGTAVVLSRQHPRAMDRIGTLSYTAPEVYDRRGATVMADCWSLGVVLYVLLVGASPFRTGEESKEVTVSRIQAGDYDQLREAWRALSTSAQDLIRRLLVVDETNRMTCVEALRHPWVDLGLSGVLQPASREPWRVRASPRGPIPASMVSSKEPGVIMDTDGGMALLRLLWRFSQLDALQQLFLVVCAQMTSEEELLQCKDPIPWYDLFFALDANEDGRLDFREFAHGLGHVLDFPCAEEHLDSLARAVDLDCSGALDWVEWVAVWLLSRQEKMCKEHEPLRTAFRLLDRPSGDSMIGAADLLAVVSAGTDMGLPGRYGREVAHQILGKWATSSPSAGAPIDATKKVKSKGRKQESQVWTPSLGMNEVRRALEVAFDPGVSEEDDLAAFTSGLSEVPLASDRLPFGCFHCCETNKSVGPLGHQVLVNQHRATGTIVRVGMVFGSPQVAVS
mmetsp:Transcript_45093/g.134762  ORF Transcript_45093/g.134762 Transcript_45093/m.134762 type:complete len:714 (-) Transcript_45093:155-2296(-)